MDKITRSRRFVPRAFAAASGEARTPFRLWMTGSLAVVMAALIPLRELAEHQRAGGLRVLRHSRFDVNETLERIEIAARGEGLTVLARLRGERPVIVLASSVGGTLIVMDEADSAPVIPLGLAVRGDGHGGADVFAVASAPGSLAWELLPDAVRRDVAVLPTLVERALG